MTDTKDKIQRSSLPIMFGMIVFAVWMVSWACINIFIQEDAVRGQFGDQFGAVNALFSGLAFAALIYTIYLQRIEIKQTQDEMKSQNETLALQRFESSFFSLMGMFNEIMGGFEVEIKDQNGQQQTYKGVGIFRRLYRVFQSDFALSVMRLDSNPPPDDKVYFKYCDVLQDSKGVFYQYFRILHRTIKFIFSSDLPADRKFEYFKIIRSLLSDDELLILFYNCRFESGKKFKEILEDNKLPLFDNLPWKRVIHSQHIQNMSIAVYGELAKDSEFLEAYNKNH